MSDDVLSRIEQKLDVLLSIAAEKPTPAALAAPTAALVGPGVVEVGGARMNLLEPIFAGWKASFTEQLLTKYGRIGGDPSNAPSGFPRRSGGGYPLFYALDGNGRPVGDPKVLYDGRTFDGEAAVAAYDPAVARRDANSTANDAEADRKVYAGPIAAGDIERDTDLAAVVYAASILYRRRQAERAPMNLNADLYRDGLVAGTNTEINRAINAGTAAYAASGKKPQSLVDAYPDGTTRAAIVRYLV